MSNIVIFVDDPLVPAPALMNLHRATGRPLNEIRSLIGSSKPLVECEIFGASLEERSATIRNVLTILESEEIEHRIYELPEGETMETCSHAERCHISIEAMRNILNHADAELETQLNDQSSNATDDTAELS